MTPAASGAVARVRVEAEACDSVAGVHLERARRTAAGILCSGLVHEFANLLTVIDGLAQIAELGIPWNDSQRMVKPPADRCHGLVDAFRHFFCDSGASASPLTLATEMRHAEQLLRARLRGRGTQVLTSGGEGVALTAARAPRLRLAYLLPLLAALEASRVLDRYPARIELSLDDAPARPPRWHAIVRGGPCLERVAALDVPNALHPASAPNAEELVRLAEGLARSCGATLALHAGSAEVGFEFTLDLADSASFARSGA